MNGKPNLRRVDVAPDGRPVRLNGRHAGCRPVAERLPRLLTTLSVTFTTEEERKSNTVAECKKKAEDAVERDAYGKPTRFKYPELRELMIDEERGQINERSFGRGYSLDPYSRWLLYSPQQKKG